jgi:hypothetical protein
MNSLLNPILRFTNSLLIIVFSGKTRKGIAKLHHINYFIILFHHVSGPAKSIFLSVISKHSVSTLNAERLPPK